MSPHLYRVVAPLGTNVRGPDASMWGDIYTGWWLQLVQMRAFVLGAKIFGTMKNQPIDKCLILW
jgi:hypothetical protein